MTQNETLLLGIDIGTTGTKCAIYDLKGELVAHAYQEYSMVHPQPSWTEQDPHRWWNAVQTNLRAPLPLLAYFISTATPRSDINK